MEMYERLEAQLELYAKLAEAEAMSGKTGVDFDEFAKKLRRKITSGNHNPGRQ
jgi:hypothetical protein